MSEKIKISKRTELKVFRILFQIKCCFRSKGPFPTVLLHRYCQWWAIQNNFLKQFLIFFIQDSKKSFFARNQFLKMCIFKPLWGPWGAPSEFFSQKRFQTLNNTYTWKVIVFWAKKISIKIICRCISLRGAMMSHIK